MPQDTVLLSHPRAGRAHLPVLDGIRGLAILMVLASHGFEANLGSAGRLTRLIGDTLYYGKFGVDLFFVLSGFLITGILLDTREEQHFFRKFYGRRVLRIFPLYYAVLVTLFLLTPSLHLEWRGMGWPMLFYLQNWHAPQICTFQLSPAIGLYHFWSLAIEEQFYLVWPLVVFFLRDRRTLLLATLSLSAGALALRLGLIGGHAGLFAIHVNTLCRADSLLLGAALAMLARTRHWTRFLRFAPRAFLFASATAVASILLFHGQEDLPASLHFHGGAVLFWTEGIRYSVVAVACAALIAWSLHPGSAPAKVLQSKFLLFFGKYSYGIYILHVILMTLLIPALRTLLRSLTHSKGLAVAGSGVIALALSVLAAMLSYRFLEQPFLRLKYLFSYAPSAPALQASLLREPAARWSYRTPSGTLESVVEEPSHPSTIVSIR